MPGSEAWETASFIQHSERGRLWCHTPIHGHLIHINLLVLGVPFGVAALTLLLPPLVAAAVALRDVGALAVMSPASLIAALCACRSSSNMPPSRLVKSCASSISLRLRQSRQKLLLGAWFCRAIDPGARPFRRIPPLDPLAPKSARIDRLVYFSSPDGNIQHPLLLLLGHSLLPGYLLRLCKCHSLH